MSKINIMVSTILISLIFMNCNPEKPEIGESFLNGQWYYFTQDSNYIEIYFKDSFVREYRGKSFLSSKKEYTIQNNQVVLDPNNKNNLYFRVLSVIDDSTLTILNSKEEKCKLIKMDAALQDFLFIDSMINKKTWDSLNNVIFGLYMNRAQAHAGTPKEKRVNFLRD